MTIIKYYTNFIGRRNPLYEKVDDPRKKGKEISKEEAKRIIREEGLVVAYKDREGTIWDTPDGAFYQEYKGTSKEIKDF